MDYMELTAPCGLDCFNCPLYLAKDNPAIRKGVAQKMNLPEEKAFCDGCRANEGIIRIIGKTETCGTYKCVKERGIHTCAECEDQFPCDRLQPYADKANVVPHNTKLFNLCLIRKMGLESWAKEKAAQVKRDYYQKELVVCEP